MIEYWQWHTLHYGTETYWGGVLPHNQQPGRVLTSSVAGETHDGTVRVELLLDREQAPVIPLQHGLPARVDVEIERASPASLVLRSVGAYTHVAAATP